MRPHRNPTSHSGVRASAVVAGWASSPPTSGWTSRALGMLMDALTIDRHSVTTSRTSWPRSTSTLPSRGGERVWRRRARRSASFPAGRVYFKKMHASYFL